MEVMAGKRVLAGEESPLYTSSVVICIESAGKGTRGFRHVERRKGRTEMKKGGETECFGPFR